LAGCTMDKATSVAATEPADGTNTPGVTEKMVRENTHGGEQTVSQTEHPLYWITQADAVADAERAIAQQDKRFLAFGGRVISLPGIDMAQYPLKVISQTCGYRVLKGTSDTLRVGESTAYRSQAHAYASRYNQRILAACPLPQ
ncbi:hypothetical protein, partial [Alteromonas sp. 14N.309.X.WAT.G.H12]|uniref:hypothetical protein n=1 Tax=Alteromonas sp. 14N.309.X.WAT.G.H12 TaxID=3120824 RepID=UPI002FD4CF7E